MPSITQHHSTNSTKLMLIGESGSGKTGSLVSLVLAGYKLRILDLENGIDIIHNLLTDPHSPYYAAASKLNLSEAVKYVTLTEHMKTVQGRILPAKATVWSAAMNQLTRWKDGEEDLGEPRSWPGDTILVIDSLTALSSAAMNFQQALSGQLGSEISSKGYEMRTDIRLAQAQVRKFLEMIYDSDFKPSVIITSHIHYRTPEGQSLVDSFGKRGYPESIGTALSPKIPRYFNNVLQCVTVGSGQSERHQITPDTWGGVSAKSTAPARLKSAYSIETGLAEFFQAVRGPPQPNGGPQV